jgi:hypothetical protein
MNSAIFSCVGAEPLRAADGLPVFPLCLRCTNTARQWALQSDTGLSGALLLQKLVAPEPRQHQRLRGPSRLKELAHVARLAPLSVACTIPRWGGLV